MPRQLTFWSADVVAPAIGDLQGLLLGPGHVVRRGRTARISVAVPAAPADRGWRVGALLEGMRELGFDGETVTTGGGGTVVRTPFVDEIGELAVGWTRGSTLEPPPGFPVDGRRLRWWSAAVGRRDPVGYLLPLGPAEPAVWPAAGAALAAAGVPATLVGARGGGPAYRVVGAKRLTRLAELVGPCPPGAPPHDWPAAP